MNRAIALTALCLLLAPAIAPAEVPAHVAAAVAAPARLDADRERDARDKPADLLAFAGVQPGMKVADVFGGGGYWSELLARAVGDKGSVTLVNNAPYFNFAREDLKARFADGRLPEVTRRVVETCDLGLGSGQYDLVVMFMAYHDVYWSNEQGGWPTIDADRFFDQLHRALKPGGKLLIVDNSAEAGSGKAGVDKLHRIDEEFAKRDLEGRGFTLEAQWDGYRNPDDDRSKVVFDPSIRHKQDRFTHLYRKR